jgi:hypothetical protein
MATSPRRRRCPRCERLTASTHCCGLDLAARRRLPWRMDAHKVRLVHTLKARKGLDDETYRLRLAAVGVDSCKQLGRSSFRTFLSGLASLPDAPGWVSRSTTRRARG